MSKKLTKKKSAKPTGSSSLKQVIRKSRSTGKTTSTATVSKTTSTSKSRNSVKKSFTRNARSPTQAPLSKAKLMQSAKKTPISKKGALKKAVIKSKKGKVSKTQKTTAKLKQILLCPGTTKKTQKVKMRFEDSDEGKVRFQSADSKTYKSIENSDKGETFLIGPEDYLHLYKADPKQVKVIQKSPADEDDLPTILFAPADYVHMYSNSKKAPKMVETDLSDAPEGLFSTVEKNNDEESSQFEEDEEESDDGGND